MTATLTFDSTSSTTVVPSLWRGALAAGGVAAVATTVIAAAAGAAGVSFETAPGEAIPLLGFGQLTLFFSVVGLGIAAGLRRWAGRPRTMWVRTTVVLTALSIVPDVLLSADIATKLSLIATHLVAAAIVIPVVARRLPEGC
jgi:hypothetical protein